MGLDSPEGNGRDGQIRAHRIPSQIYGRTKLSAVVADLQASARDQSSLTSLEGTAMPRTRSPLVNLPGKWKFLKTQHGFHCAPILTLIRLISWAVRCCVQRTVIVNLRRWNVQMSLPGAWRGLGKFLFVFRENYEPELAYLEKLLSPGMTFIDVGANFGVYTVVASKLVGEAGRVIAFEPTAQSFDVLRKNVGLNDFKNVLTFRAAVSDKPGTGWIYYGTDPVQNSLGKNPYWEAGGEEVVMESLDHVLQQAGVDRVDVIKIDAEGAEEL